MTVVVRAPAKINLTLEVLGKRADGYHEIRSVIQAVSLCDTLRFSPAEQMEFRSLSPGWDAELSLVSRAARLVREVTGHSGGAVIEVEKRIPLTAGLGGDSSDAAAVLGGLNELWRLGLSAADQVKLAARLGSDVAFFVCGGTALVSGRGEVVTRLPPAAVTPVVLVEPHVGRQTGKTAAMYAALREWHYTDGSISERLAADIRVGKPIRPDLLFNTFENLAFTRGSELETCRSHIRKIGAPHVHLAGSGPALFTLLPDMASAEGLAARLKTQNMIVCVAETRGC